MQTIIDIGVSGSEANVTSYEDAFGEFGQDQYYSEARGDGRKRRQAKKIERIANRKDVSLAKRDLRQSKQQARIEQRRAAMASRQNISTERKRTRQDRKNEQQQYRQGRKDTSLQSRQARKDFAKTARVNRRGIGQEEDAYEEEDPTLQNNTGVEPGYDESQDTGYDQSQDLGYEDQEVTSEDGYGDNIEDDNIIDDTEEPIYENEDEYEGFDGGDEFSHQESPEVDYIDIEAMPVYKTALRLEQNKEKVAQLSDKVNMLQSKKIPCPNLVDEINTRKQIVSNLEGQLDEYSSASGETSALTTLAKWKANLKRLEHKNQDGRLDGVVAKRRESIINLESRINDARKKKLTKIDPKIKAKVETKPEQIIVNPDTTKSNSVGPDVEIDIEHEFDNACGACGMSNGMMTGFDGGEFDKGNSSFATGDIKTKSPLANMNWKGIAIGVGISALLIWGAERMKLFGGK